MTKLTIAAAAKRAGVTSRTFNNRYVKTELIAVLEESGKKYVSAAALTKLLAESKKKAPTKTTEKPKTNTVKMTEIEKLKLQIKKLKAEFKAVITENELLQKQNESLNRTNSRLTKKPAAPRSKTAAKAKPSVRKKPIALTIPDPEKMPKAPAKPRAKQKKKISRSEHWVDKWWDKF